MKNSMPYLFQIFVILILIFKPVFPNDKLVKINFCPQYLPQAQFAGFFIAKEKGFYKKHNLDVTIKTYDVNGCVTTGLQNNSLDIGTYFLSSAMKLKASGMNIVNIGQVSKQSALILLAKKESGINTPEDIQGRKIGLYLDDFNIQYKGFFKKYNLKNKIIPVFSGINLFLAGGTDMTTVMWYNEYHTIMNSGYNADELTPFFLKDYGFDIPEDGIYCMEKTWQENPQACGDFVEATMEAWAYAFQHPEEAIEIVIQYMKAAHVPANKAHQQWMLKTMKEIIFPNTMKINTLLSEQDFEKAHKILMKNSYMESQIEYKNFYKPAGKYAK